MIIPSLLTLNKRVAQERINYAKQMSGWIHVDVLDHTLYLFESLSIKELETLEFGDLMIEAHCMTNAPEQVVQSAFGPDRVILHVEMKGWKKTYDSLVSKGVETWLAIDPHTKIETVELPEDLTGILLLGVEPGQTGQEFLTKTYERVEQFKEYRPDVSVTIDGGVNRDNARLLIAHGADHLVAGNALFHQSNPVEAYRELVRVSDPLGGVQ